MNYRNLAPQRAPAFVLLPSMTGGLLLSKALPVDQAAVAWIALLLAAAAYWLALRGKTWLWLTAFTCAATSAFWAYGSLRLPRDADAFALSLPPRETRLALKLERVMQAKNSYGKATGIARVLEAPETSRLPGNARVYFRFSREDTAVLKPVRGLVVEITGVTYPIPDDVAPDSFEAYLKDTGVHYRFARTSAPSIVRDAPTFKRFCYNTRQRFQRYLHLGEPDGSKLAGIYTAMLLGQKAELTRDQADRFRMTGTMHLFAISGLHIGVVATVIAQALLLLRLPRALRPLVGLPLLYLYVEITGAPPSAVRAFLMIAFFWASFVLQRQRSPVAALAASAVFVLLAQPSQLWQTGFQLSYLVVLSILLFGLPLYERLWQRLRPFKYLPPANCSNTQKLAAWAMDKLLMLFAISFSAWLASAPLSASSFGFIAPYAVWVNMLLVNLAALAISAGVIALALATAGLESFTAFLNHSAWVSISLMDSIVRLNVALPGAVIERQDFPKLVGYTGALTYVATLFLMPATRLDTNLRFILPPAVILLSLFSGLALSGG